MIMFCQQTSHHFKNNFCEMLKKNEDDVECLLVELF